MNKAGEGSAIDLNKQHGYNMGYIDGFKDGYNKAFELFEKEIRLAVLSRPLQITMPMIKKD